MASVRGPTDDATSSDPPLSPLSKRFFRIRQFRTRSSGWRKQPHPHGVTPPPFPCLRVYYWRTPRNIIGKTKSAHLFLQYGSVKTEERFTTFGRNAPTGIPNSLAVGRNTFWFFFPNFLAPGTFRFFFLFFTFENLSIPFYVIGHNSSSSTHCWNFPLLVIVRRRTSCNLTGYSLNWSLERVKTFRLL